MIVTRTFFTIVFSTSVLLAYSQADPEAEAKFDSAYAVRIQLEEIDGVYIPANLEEAFVELERLTSDEVIEEFKEAPEEVIERRLHFGLGRWIIYNWGFYEGSRLSHLLRQKGLEHPDDMARLIIVGFHRHLNELPLKVDEQIEGFQKLREAERLEREQRKEVIEEQTRIRKKNN